MLSFKKLFRKWQKRKTMLAQKKKKIPDLKSKWERSVVKERKARREVLQVVMLVVKRVILKSWVVQVLVMLILAQLVHSMSKISSS